MKNAYRIISEQHGNMKSSVLWSKSSVW